MSTPREAVAVLLEGAFSDLEQAFRGARNGVWSIECGNVACDIVRLLRLYRGPFEWERCPVTVLRWHKTLHDIAGVGDPEPVNWDWVEGWVDRVRGTLNRSDEYREFYRSCTGKDEALPDSDSLWVTAEMSDFAIDWDRVTKDLAELIRDEALCNADVPGWDRWEAAADTAVRFLFSGERAVTYG